MNRKKAIEILSNLLADRQDLASLDLGTAVKLGIEAIEFIQKWQDQLIEEGFSPLPGEDES